jgi:hypothetical protein
LATVDPEDPSWVAVEASAYRIIGVTGRGRSTKLGREVQEVQNGQLG